MPCAPRAARPESGRSRTGCPGLEHSTLEQRNLLRVDGPHQPVLLVPAPIDELRADVEQSTPRVVSLPTALRQERRRSSLPRSKRRQARITARQSEAGKQHEAATTDVDQASIEDQFLPTSLRTSTARTGIEVRRRKNSRSAASVLSIARHPGPRAQHCQQSIEAPVEGGRAPPGPLEAEASAGASEARYSAAPSDEHQERPSM